MSHFKSPSWATRIDAAMADEVIRVASRSRLRVFGAADPHSEPVIVVAAHGQNIVLCEALYPVLHMLEITIRNKVHEAFSLHFGTERWFDGPWLKPRHAFLVHEVRLKLRARRKPDDTDSIVAALTFGFWCAMFGGGYEEAGGPWPSLIPRVVPGAPKSWRTRARISARVEQARLLRNRVFHHDPIGHQRNLSDQHRSLMELLGWFSRGARDHVDGLCRFRSVLADAPQPSQIV